MDENIGEDSGVVTPISVMVAVCYLCVPLGTVARASLLPGRGDMWYKR